MDPIPSGNLEEQVVELRSRLRRLEETLLSYGIDGPRVLPAAPKAAAEPHASQPVQATSIPQAPQASEHLQPAQPQPAPAPMAGMVNAQATQPRSAHDFTHPPKPSDDHSLESRIGSQWFNRIGILAVLIGVAWFLKFAFDNHWIGAGGRVLIGLISGGALIAWSERFQHRGYKLFGYSLKAVGSGILYLSLWAAFSVFHLIPSGAAFAAMILVTAFNGFMAWMQDAELLALYAIVGGLSTPLLLSTGENHEVTLFSYILVLDIAVLILAALRPWSRLLVLAFAGTVFFFVGWSGAFYSDAQFGRTTFFLACYFLSFAFAPRLIRLGSEDIVHASGWNALALMILPIANAALGFVAFYYLIEPKNSEWAGPWLAVGFAAFYLLLLRLPAAGPLRPSHEILSGLHLTAAVVFLTIAIPLKTHGRWLTIGWLVEGAALLWLAIRIRSMLLRVLSLLCLALGLVALVTVNPPASTTPLFNQRFATYFLGIAVAAFVAWLANQERLDENAPSKEGWMQLAAVAVVAVNALILLGIGWEIHSYWWYLRWRGDWTLLNDYRMYTQFTYSAFFMLFGAILLSVGFGRHSAFLRWQALLLVAATIAKVFLMDISELSQGYRIVSFLGLGALLLGVSFVYQRDLLHLRSPSPHKPDQAIPDATRQDPDRRVS